MAQKAVGSNPIIRPIMIIQKACKGLFCYDTSMKYGSPDFLHAVDNLTPVAVLPQATIIDLAKKVT